MGGCQCRNDTSVWFLPQLLSCIVTQSDEPNLINNSEANRNIRGIYYHQAQKCYTTSYYSHNNTNKNILCNKTLSKLHVNSQIYTICITNYALEVQQQKIYKVLYLLSSRRSFIQYWNTFHEIKQIWIKIHTISPIISYLIFPEDNPLMKKKWFDKNDIASVW